MRRGAGMDGDETLGRRDRVIPFGRIGEDRRGMAVLAHAEHRDARHAVVGVRVQRGDVRVERGARVDERQEAGRGGGVLQQRVAHELRVAGCIVLRHPAVVDQRHVDAGPVERRVRQRVQERARKPCRRTPRASARGAGERAAQRIADGARERFALRFLGVESVNLDHISSGLLCLFKSCESWGTLPRTVACAATVCISSLLRASRCRAARASRSPRPAPRARRIRLRRLQRACPFVQDRLDPAPRGFLFVASHEEGEAAVDHVEQQALVRLHLPFLEELVEREVEVHAREVHPFAGLLREAVQADRLVRLQPDHEAVRTGPQRGGRAPNAAPGGN